MSANLRQAISEVQFFLRGIVPGLVVDGYFGPKTKKALNSCAPQQRAEVEKILRRHGFTMTDVMRLDVLENKRTNIRVDGATVVALVTLECDRFGAGDEIKSALSGLARKYNDGTANGGDRSGTARGVMRINLRNWNEARRFAVEKRTTLPEYGDGVYNVADNVRAAVLYTMLMVRSIRRRTGTQPSSQVISSAYEGKYIHGSNVVRSSQPKGNGVKSMNQTAFTPTGAAPTGSDLKLFRHPTILPGTEYRGSKAYVMALDNAAKTQLFVNELLPALGRVLDSYGVAKATQAFFEKQVRIESGHGKRMSAPYNYSGIKASDADVRAGRAWKPLLTSEYNRAGKLIRWYDRFRAFDSAEDFCQFYVASMKRKWPGTLTALTPKQFNTALLTVVPGSPGKYHTDISYDTKLAKVQNTVLGVA